MQKKLRSEKPSIKKLTERLYPDRFYLNVSDPDVRKKVMQQFLDLCATGKYTFSCEITCLLDKNEEYYADLAQKYPDVADMYKKGMAHLGCTGIVGMRDGKYKEKAILPFLYQKLSSYKTAEERQHAMALKQNEAMGEGIEKAQQRLCLCEKFNYRDEHGHLIPDAYCDRHGKGARNVAV